MFTLRDVHTSDPSYLWVEQLWLASFPCNERRDTEAQRNNVDSRANFHCLLAEDDGKAVPDTEAKDSGAEQPAPEPEVKNAE